jgi:glycerophosphoryl diester phosphodiesterase
MIDILAHRGWWLTKGEQNSMEGFRRAIASGYGIETDIRDHNGRLVVSHDPPNDSSIPIERLIELCKRDAPRVTLALNIKADGLASPLAELLRRLNWDGYFVFDMSVPDTLPYLAKDMPVFTRRSEFELGSPMDDRSAGLWLDSFETPFVPPTLLLTALSGKHDIAIVSPELHGRPHLAAWQAWRDVLRARGNSSGQRVHLCTDFPKDAEAFFVETIGD